MDNTLPGKYYIGAIAGENNRVSLLILDLIRNTFDNTSDKQKRKFLLEIQTVLLNIPDEGITPNSFVEYLEKVKDISLKYKDTDNNDFIAALNNIVNSQQFIVSQDWIDILEFVDQSLTQWSLPALKNKFPSVSAYYSKLQSILNKYPQLDFIGLNKLIDEVKTLNGITAGSVKVFNFDGINVVLDKLIAFQNKVAIQSLAFQNAELAALKAAKAKAEADRALFEAQTLEEKKKADAAQAQAEIAAQAADKAAQEAINAANAKTTIEANTAATNAGNHATTAKNALSTIKTINKPIVDPRTPRMPTTPNTPTTPTTPTATTPKQPNYLLIGGLALGAILLLKK